MATNNDGNLYAELLPADQRVEAASGTQEIADGCLDSRVVDLRSRVEEQLNANLLFNSSMAGATGSVLPTNWASGSVSGLTYTISSASTVAGFRAIEWTVSGTALSDGEIYLACEPMQSGSVVAQIPNEYIGTMYCAKVSGTIKAGMVLQTLTQNFVDGAVQETKTKDLAAVTGQTFVRIEPNSVKTDIDLENRVNLRLYQPISSGEAVDFTIRVAAPQIEAGFAASPFISTVSGAVSEVRGRPSVLVVPQLTKAGTVYPQIPVVSGADFTFTRATTATRVNASGLIESVASGVPRIDWLGQSCPGLLVEASAQNQALWSRDLSVSGTWAASGITAVRNAVGADGTASGATTLTATAASATITQNISHASQSRIFSAYMRRVSGSGQIQLTTNGGTNWETVTLTSAFAPFNSGAQTVASGQVGIRMIASGDVIEVDFTQAEVGPIATSPIPTTTGAVSRAADVISASGALVSGLIGQTEGTIYAEVDVRSFASTTSRAVFYISDGSMQNYIRLEYQFFSPRYVLVVSLVQAGVTIYEKIATTGTDVVNGTIKIAFGYSSGNNEVFQNGAILSGSVTGVGTYASLTGLSKLNLGSRGTDLNQFNDRIRAAALYTTRLSNDQLAELTRL